MLGLRKTPQIKQIYFDLGNLLYPTEPYKERVVRQWAMASKMSESELREILYYGRSHPKRQEFWAVVDIFDKGEIFPEHLHLEMKRILELEMSFDDFVASWESVLEPDYDFIQMVEEIEGPYLGIISNLCVLHHRKVAKTLPRKKFRNCLYSFVEHILKPEDEMFLLSIHDSGFPPENLLFFDDWKPNIEAAARNGMNVYHYDVHDGRSREERLRQLRCYLKSFGFIK